MTALPESLTLGSLPKDDGEKPEKRSKARDFVVDRGLKPHPTKKSFGILPDGREVPLSPSQIRALMTTPPVAAPAKPADSSSTVLMLDALRRLLEVTERIEAGMKRVEAILLDKERI